MSRRKLIGLLMAAGVVLMAGGFVIWRYTAPIEIRIEAEIHDNLPFVAETIPPVVQARPGEMVKVIYRIYNQDARPLEAFGRYEISPASATDQIKVFLTQCSGLNTFQNGFPSDYEVLFRVQPAGLTGATQLALRHVFDQAAPR